MDPSPGLTLATLFADFGMILFALILVLLNGFFVAAEFAMVKLRSTRVEAIADQNGWRGRILRTVHSQLDAYLSACQLGITLASLGLGWVGEPAFAHLLEPLLSALGVESAEVVKGVKAGQKAVISGYHDSTGNLAQNQELAKKRAFSVRDALVALGVPAEQIELKKPEQSAGSGDNAEARRVEVVLSK